MAASPIEHLSKHMAKHMTWLYTDELLWDGIRMSFTSLSPLKFNICLLVFPITFHWNFKKPKQDKANQAKKKANPKPQHPASDE